MTRQNTAYAYAAVAVILWSTVASAFKLSLKYMDHVHLLLYSSAASALLLLIVVLLKGKPGLVLKFRPRDYAGFAVLGLLNPFAYYVLLFKAYALLPAQEAQPLNYTWPVMLSLLSVPLLKQKLSLKSAAGIGLSFIGAFIISTRGDFMSFRFSNPAGVLLALGSAVIWAVYWICNLKNERDSVTRLFFIFLFGLIYVLIYIVLLYDPVLPEPRGIVYAVYVGLFEMGLTFIVWLKALELSKSTAKVAGMIYLVPFLSLVVIHFVLGERILASSVTGLVVIVAGILVQKKK